MDFKEGDWHCSQCGDHQFARNATCRKCGAPRDGGGRGGRMMQAVPPPAARGGCGGDYKQGDWTCSDCGDHQFARNASCRKCGAPRPDAGGFGGMAGLGGMPAIGQSQGYKAGGIVGLADVPGAAGIHPQYLEQAANMLGVSISPRGSVASSLPGGAALGAGFKPGDWNCPSCGDHQFGRNETCRKCGTPKPGDVSASQHLAALSQSAPLGGRDNSQDFKPGDWKCPRCGDHQFERNAACRKCGEPKPAQSGGAPQVYGIAGSLLADIQARAVAGGPPMSGGFKPGDWTCAACGDHQFGRNETCRKCGSPKPVLSSNNQAMKPGDWLCPACGDLQFARNEACRKCGASKPDENARSRSPVRRY
ncbi:unnamed protein product [Symbiodinium natans]|uniref:RanBP2-type domain-containing protein n=1 Tax=Symbiodinium natans TaxID=878477 RepID=A0A812TGQ5_9DINO|nr:unnamed protein product [Symbiodinium natans]